MERFHCETCIMFIKPKNKSRHFKSNNHEKLDKHRYKN